MSRYARARSEPADSPSAPAASTAPAGEQTGRREPLEVHLTVHVDGELLGRFDRRLARDFEVVPLHQLGDILLVASEKPLTADELGELSRRAGIDVHAIPSQVASFAATLRTLYDDSVSRRRDEGLGETLIELGLLTEQQLRQALAHQQRQNNPSFSPVLSIDPSLLHLLPEGLARTHNVLPLYRASGSLILATAEQPNDRALEEIEAVTSLSPALVIAAPDALRDALTRCYQLHQRFELRRMWLGEILISRGLITRPALDLCLAAQRTSRKKLGELLVANDYISEDALFPILAEKLGMDYRSFENQEIDHQLTHLVSERFAERNLVLPVRLDHENSLLDVATSDPTNLQVRDMLQSVSEAQGARLNLILSGPARIREAIRYAYSFHRQMEVDLEELAIGSETERRDDSRPTSPAAEDLAKMRRILNKLLYEAVTDGASDIHIENLETRTQIRFRVGGILHERTTPINKGNVRKIISVLKADSGLHSAGRRRAQDGVFKMRIGSERDIDFRINVHATQFGEDAVIRVLDKTRNLLSLDELGFSASVQARYEALVANPRGLILITGPTGSGKTTTLYASLAELRRNGAQIITAEDPVEYQLDDVTQYQVNDSVGNTFAEYTKRFLRKDPDAILVGEVRDVETAVACMRAAVTGHLVFSTLHINDAVSAVQRLRDLSLDCAPIADALLCVIQQRLARRNCPECLASYTPDPQLVRDFFPDGAAPDENRFVRGTGCARCHGKGMRGRVGLYEFWEIAPATRAVIDAGHDEGTIRRSAVDNGLESLVADALEKVYRGVTTLEELGRVIPIEQIRGHSGRNGG